MVLLRLAQRPAALTAAAGFLSAALACGALACAPAAHAHEFSVGDITVEHPYATPTPPGATAGAVYFRALVNGGKRADRLVAAQTDVAERVELHRTLMQDGVARMRETDAIEIPAGGRVDMRHGRGLHLMLVGLKRPLAIGDRFEVRLRFEHAGEGRVRVDVAQPKDASAGHQH